MTTTWPDKVRLKEKWLLQLVIASDPTMSRCDVACAMHILNHYNPAYGKAWPSCARLAELCGVSRRSITDSLARLTAAGYFRISGGKRQSYSYYPDFDKAQSASPAAPDNANLTSDNSGPNGNLTSDNSGANGNPSAPLCEAEFPPNANPASPYTSYIHVATSVVDVRGSSLPSAASSAGAADARHGQGKALEVPDGFETLWTVYPRKAGRARAVTAFRDLMSTGRVPAEQLAAKATEFARHTSAIGTDPAKVTWLHTWIEQEKWAEDYLQPRPKEPPTPKPVTKAAKAPTAKAGTPPKKARRKAAKTTRKAAQPASGRGLTPQAVAAPAIARTPDEPFIVFDRVEEARTKRNWTGKVTRIVGDGRVRVAWDHGGGGICHVTDLASTSIGGCEGLRRNRERGA